MNLVKRLFIIGGMISLPFLGCEKEVVKYVYEYPYDILGNIEYERDGDFTTDDYNDEDIDVVLTFEAKEYGFEPGDVVAYYKTVDADPINYWFKFIPKGWYGIEASLWDMDVYIWKKSDDFYHKDEEDTYVDLELWMPTARTTAKTSNKRQSLGEILDKETLYVSKPMYDLMKQNIIDNNPEMFKEFEQTVQVMEDIQNLRDYLRTPRNIEKNRTR